MKKIVLGAVALFSFSNILCAGQSQTAPWWQSKVTYEIFVRSFQDSNGDGVGDLDGITSRLDYLQNLGIGALWLTPIFESPSYHGYDASNFLAINKDFGDDAALQRLLKSAHSRSMKVILDLAVNHTSSQHPWFLSSSSAETSPYRDYYVWSPTPLHWSALGQDPEKHWHLLNGEYYYSFFSPSLPDLNWTNEEVKNEITQIFLHWTNEGVDGFRLDAARFLVEGPNGESDTPATHAVWKGIVSAVKRVNPNAYFVGEVWADAPTIESYYGNGDELTAAFNFPVSFGIVNSLSSETGNPYLSALASVEKSVKPTSFAAPFLTNHDMVRAASTLGNNLAKLKLAALAYLSLPGTPFVYYGEELGLPNGNLKGDLAKRTPMPWDSSALHGFTSHHSAWESFAPTQSGLNVEDESVDPQSLLNTYKTLIALRNSNEVLQGGAFQNLSQAAQVVSFIRQKDNKSVLIVLNFQNKNYPIFNFNFNSQFKLAKILYGDSTISFQNNVLTLHNLAPFGGCIIELD